MLQFSGQKRENPWAKFPPSFEERKSPSWSHFLNSCPQLLHRLGKGFTLWFNLRVFSGRVVATCLAWGLGDGTKNQTCISSGIPNGGWQPAPAGLGAGRQAGAFGLGGSRSQDKQICWWEWPALGQAKGRSKVKPPRSLDILVVYLPSQNAWCVGRLAAPGRGAGINLPAGPWGGTSVGHLLGTTAGRAGSWWHDWREGGRGPLKGDSSWGRQSLCASVSRQKVHRVIYVGIAS